MRPRESVGAGNSGRASARSGRSSADEAPARSPTTSTERVLNAGSLVSGACFLVALVLVFLGRSAGAGDPLDPGGLVRALVELRPWGWAALGVLTMIATPAVGLIATAAELRSTDSKSALFAVLVLGVLFVGLALALVRSAG